LEQTLLRLFGFVLFGSRMPAHGGHDASPGPEGPACATGRSFQALPNTLIVKYLADKVRFSLHGNRPVSPGPPRRSPIVRRVLQSSPACLARQPLGRRGFLDFLWGVPSANSLNLLHLPGSVKGRFAPFRRPFAPHHRLGDSRKG
jgi:hypothetical protein